MAKKIQTKRQPVRKRSRKTPRPATAPVARSSGDAGDAFNFNDPVVLPVRVGKKPNLEERHLTPRQKWALMAVAPELYLACLNVRSYLSGGKQDPRQVVDLLDAVLEKAIPRAE